MYETDDLINKAGDQYERGRYEECIVSSEKGIAIDEGETDFYWFAALSYQALGNLDNALKLLLFVIELSPNFSNGWARYGAVLQSLNADEDEQYNEHIYSQEAFQKAIEIEPEHVSALKGLSDIYIKNVNPNANDSAKEMHVLTKLEEIGERLTYTQSHRLGLLHYNDSSFFKAIEYWAYENNYDVVGGGRLFNLGLAYSRNEVSQDADAIDIWRLAVKKYPDYEPSYEQIDKLLPRLLKLNTKAMNSGESLLDSSQWYKNYINPFELLNFNDDIKFSNIDSIDIKKIQKHKKILLQEIELEDGHIYWMKGLNLDRSKAISVCDELSKKINFNHHFQVFVNKPLLAFLTKGEHKHFTVDMYWSPLETIEYLNDFDNGFKSWLTEPFSSQYDLVISKSIDTGNIGVLEVLLDGRRWVDSPNAEHFFESARKKIDIKLENLEKVNITSKKQKPTIELVTKAIKSNSLLNILNILPTFFWDKQDKAVILIRDIAVSCYNYHGDANLSKEILNLTNLFIFKSKKSKELIKKDSDSLTDIQEKEKLNLRKNEFSIMSGSTLWKITSDGVTKGDLFIPTKSITSVRWGASITGNQSFPTHEYSFVIKSKTKSVVFKWDANSINDVASTGFNIIKSLVTDTERNESPFSKSNSDKLNGSIINSILNYIIPSLYEKKLYAIKHGGVFNISDIKINASGIEWEKSGFFSTKKIYITWKQLILNISNGELEIKSSNDKKNYKSLSLRNTDNLYLLLILKDELTK